MGEFGPLYEITRSLLVLTARDVGARKKGTKKYQFLDKHQKMHTISLKILLETRLY